MSITKAVKVTCDVIFAMAVAYMVIGIAYFVYGLAAQAFRHDPVGVSIAAIITVAMFTRAIFKIIEEKK